MTSLVLRLDGFPDRPSEVLMGRVAVMVVFLVAEAERVNRATRGSVTFDFDGPCMKPSIHEHYPQLNTPR